MADWVHPLQRDKQKFDPDKYPAGDPFWTDPKISEEVVSKYFWHPPKDARFPNQNVTKRCWTHYIDFHKCLKLKGEDYEPCYYLKRLYSVTCPVAWVEKWDDWMEENKFPHDWKKYDNAIAQHEAKKGK